MLEDYDLAFSPGYYIEEYMASLDVDIGCFAKDLGIRQYDLYLLLSGEKKVTKDIALRLADLTGVSDSYWLNLQKKYDDTICKSIQAKSIDAKSVQTRLLTEDEYEKITDPNVDTKEKNDIIVKFLRIK